MDSIFLDGSSLTFEKLRNIQNLSQKVEITSEAWIKIDKARAVIDDILRSGRTTYGVNTGIGTRLGNVVISASNLEELNVNMIRSHCVGIGKPLSPERTRAMMAVRLNSMAMGFAGISRENVEKLIAALNQNCLPQVPQKGTVGAHDLAQLSHLTLGLMGEGQMWSPETGVGNAADILKSHGLTSMVLKPKDAISMINGTGFVTALGSEAADRAQLVVEMADVVAAMSVEGLVATNEAFDQDIHKARPHKGQIKVARKIRALISNSYQKSELGESWSVSRVQDPYTLRCIPQVHGVSHDIVEFASDILSNELNSANDNPMVIVDGEIGTVSNGNFHGEYAAKALDYIAIGVHEIGNMSERRIERLCNPACSELPAFLTVQGGLNSGFMIAQITASALVSENKTLCHPASVDTIPTSAGFEDHVSMGGWAARKALDIIENVEFIIAIELICACQAIDLRRPLRSTPILEKLHAEVRKDVPFMNTDRVISEDLNKVHRKIKSGEFWKLMKTHIDNHRD